MLPRIFQEILQVVNHLLVVFCLLDKIHALQDVWVARVSLVELVTDTGTTAVEVKIGLRHFAVVSYFVAFWRPVYGRCLWSKPREALVLHGRLADVFADVQRRIVDSLTGRLLGDFFVEGSCVAKATWQVN